jgi:hypothetical protein
VKLSRTSQAVKSIVCHSSETVGRSILAAAAFLGGSTLTIPSPWEI